MKHIKTVIIQLIVLAILLFILEVGFRLLGHQPGMYDKSFNPVDTLIYEPRYWCDSLGINRNIKETPKGYFPDGYIINKEGFRSNFDFSKEIIDSIAAEEGAKKVMLVGDSYTEGCCASPIDGAFTDLLDKEKDILGLNFGVGATDLIQYRLIVQEYVPTIQPDLVVVVVYLGNDILYRNRPPMPHTPSFYPIKNCAWLPSEIPYILKDQRKEFFSTPQEAYDTFYNKLTLFGKDRTLMARICKHSVVLTRLYFIFAPPDKGVEDNRFTLSDADWALAHKNKPPFSYRELKHINSICQKEAIPLLIVAIPSPVDAKKNVDLKDQYDFVFNELEWVGPDTRDYSLLDYDGKTIRNHFNHQGHQKFYEFLSIMIKNKFKKMK